MLKTLNSTVHHEMIGPLKSCVMISQRLINLLPNTKEKYMAEVILFASQLVLFHANDLLDHRIIESGGFVPTYSQGSVSEAILEIIKIVQFTLTQTKLQLKSVQKKEKLPKEWICHYH